MAQPRSLRGDANTWSPSSHALILLRRQLLNDCTDCHQVQLGQGRIPGAGQGENHSIKPLSPLAPTGSKHRAHTCGCSPDSFRPRCLISAWWGRGWSFKGSAEMRSLGIGTGKCCRQSPCSLPMCLGAAGSSGHPAPGWCCGHPEVKVLPPRSTPGPWQLPVNGTGKEPLLGFTH